MNLLNYTYVTLIEIDEIETAEELSQNWFKPTRAEAVNFTLH
jgi:hypothetical protein